MIIYFVGFLLSICTILVINYVRRFITTLLSKVNTESSEHGGMIVAETLKAHGVKFIFTLCGGHVSSILIAAEKLDIRVIDVRNEANAVFAADAVARCGGQAIGVACVTAGPGLTNTITALKNAQMAESPVLLLAGAAASALKGRGALQDIDQLGLVGQLCKFSRTVTRVRDISGTLREAIQTAQCGTPGPVFVEFPIDTLYPYPVVKREIGLNPRPKTLLQRFLNFYLQYYLKNLFGDAFLTRPTAPFPITVPLPSPSQLGRVATMIRAAKKPLMLIGSQAIQPPVEPDRLVACVKELQIPCYLGGMSRGLLGRNSPLQFRQNRKEALAEADLIILAGTVCDFRLSYGRSLGKKAKIISINRSKANMYKNSDMFWRPTLAIQADVASTVCGVSELIGAQAGPGLPDWSDWKMTLQQRENVKEEENKKMAEQETKTHLNPLKVLRTLENIGLGEKAVLVADGGDFVGSAAYILRPRGPHGWLDPGVFGTLGVGAGFALGVKLCRPEADVWIVYGDGSLGYSIVEWDTFQRHGVGVIGLVGNDACWSQIAREQVPMFGSNVGCQLDFTRYDAVAEGLGGRGLVLDKTNFTSEAAAAAIMQQAVDIARQGRPVLINCLIGTTNFRDGSISV